VAARPAVSRPAPRGRLDASCTATRLSVQLQEAQLQKRIKVREAVDLWATLYERPVDTGRLLDQLGLTAKRDAWFMTLSGGQKQRLFIALALINDPEVVFLDELTTGLDPQARRTIWDLVQDIRARGKRVFLTTHLMEEAERLCDRVAIIEHGRIIDMGTPESLVARHCPERTVVLVTDDAPPLAASAFMPVLISLLIALNAVLSLVTIVAIYREGGILKRLRATPLRSHTILTAHVLVRLLLTGVTLGLTVLATGRTQPVALDARLLGFSAALLISTVSLLSIGFLIASVVPTARFA
jgi:hypothetical protein